MCTHINLHLDYFVFLVNAIQLDPNIPETGEQLARSNNGPATCCYEYCDHRSVYKGICAYCNETEGDPADLPAEEKPSQQQKANIEMTSNGQRSGARASTKMEPPPQTCHLVSCLLAI